MILYRPLMLIVFVSVTACADSVKFIKVENHKGVAKHIYEGSTNCLLIRVDSLKTDSTIHSQFKIRSDDFGVVDLSSYWFVTSINSSTDTIELSKRATGEKIRLHKDQIAFVNTEGPYALVIIRGVVVRLVLYPAYVASFWAIFAPVAGLVSLPFPQTPWQVDLKIIGSGVAVWCVFGLMSLIPKMDPKDDDYKILELHEADTPSHNMRLTRPLPRQRKRPAIDLR